MPVEIQVLKLSKKVRLLLQSVLLDLPMTSRFLKGVSDRGSQYLCLGYNILD
jgi:hypothetical protein